MYIDLDWQRILIGEDASCMVKPLSIVAYQKVAAKMQGNNVDILKGKDNPADTFSNFDIGEMLELCKMIFPGNVKDVSGITFKYEEKEHQATVEDLLKHEAFALVNVQILVQLFSISTISGIKQPEEKEGLLPEQQKKQENDALLRR